MTIFAVSRFAVCRSPLSGRASVFVKNCYTCTPDHPFNPNTLFSRNFSTSMALSVGNRLRWDLTPASIQKDTEVLMTKTKTVYDNVGSLSAETVTYENIVKVGHYTVL